MFVSFVCLCLVAVVLWCVIVLCFRVKYSLMVLCCCLVLLLLACVCLLCVDVVCVFYVDVLLCISCVC